MGRAGGHRRGNPSNAVPVKRRAPGEGASRPRGSGHLPVPGIGLEGGPPETTDSSLPDARASKFQVLLVWALDRLSREGPWATLEIAHRLGQSDVQVWSYQESWTEAGGELIDLLLAIAGWVARMESNRRSERTRAVWPEPRTKASGWVGHLGHGIRRSAAVGGISRGGPTKQTGYRFRRATPYLSVY